MKRRKRQKKTWTSSRGHWVLHLNEYPSGEHALSVYFKDKDPHRATLVARVPLSSRVHTEAFLDGLQMLIDQRELDLVEERSSGR